jgi:hypothetical protein
MSVQIDEPWTVNEEMFISTSEIDFMEEIRQYPVLYDTTNRLYKNSRTTKQNALREIARKLEGTIEMVETR